MQSLIDGDFAAWQTTMPPCITNDIMWKSVAYRLGLFAQEWVVSDLELLSGIKRAQRLLDQLERAAQSISETFSEGYARRPGRDRLRFYEYSLGSSRESRDVWLKLHRFLTEDRYNAGLELFTRLVQILTVVVRKERESI